VYIDRSKYDNKNLSNDSLNFGFIKNGNLLNYSNIRNEAINPKRHGLFGQLDTWGGGGGWKPPIVEQSGKKPNNFIPQPSPSHSQQPKIDF
jgi:hypothetical protein